MKTVTRILGLLGGLQVLAVLFGHACAVAGNSWLEKVYDIDLSDGPAVTQFYMSYGLWLLFVPIVWLALALMLTKSTTRPFVGWVCLITGVVLLLVLVTTGFGALLVPMFPMSGGWHGGVR